MAISGHFTSKRCNITSKRGHIRALQLQGRTFRHPPVRGTTGDSWEVRAGRVFRTTSSKRRGRACLGEGGDRVGGGRECYREVLRKAREGLVTAEKRTRESERESTLREGLTGRPSGQAHSIDLGRRGASRSKALTVLYSSLCMIELWGG